MFVGLIAVSTYIKTCLLHSTMCCEILFIDIDTHTHIYIHTYIYIYIYIYIHIYIYMCMFDTGYMS